VRFQIFQIAYICPLPAAGSPCFVCVAVGRGLFVIVIVVVITGIVVAVIVGIVVHIVINIIIDIVVGVIIGLGIMLHVPSILLSTYQKNGPFVDKRCRGGPKGGGFRKLRFIDSMSKMT